MNNFITSVQHQRKITACEFHGTQLKCYVLQGSRQHYSQEIREGEYFSQG
jgi:hypothetical protein